MKWEILRKFNQMFKWFVTFLFRKILLKFLVMKKYSILKEQAGRLYEKRLKNQ